MDVTKAIKICFDNKIAVYPVIFNKKHKIEYSINGIPKKRYDKILTTSKSVDEAMSKTYIFLAEKLNSEKITSNTTVNK